MTLPLPALPRALHLLLPVMLALPSALAQSPTVHASGEGMRLRSWTVSGSGAAVSVRVVVDDDNGDGSLPTSFRRWWHFEVGGLDPSVATTLSVRVDNAGYSDVILPVWSRSTDGGASFGPFERCPTSAVPQVSGSTHTFAITAPAGVTHVRLAKFFPYPVTRRDALLASIAGHPHVRSIRSLGTTALGRSIDLVEITDSSVPDQGKRRVWVHAAIHPAETPAAFMAEGLIEFLLSGTPVAEFLLDRLIVDVVPLANPDGNAIGNYRTNSQSVNCEAEWSAPYDAPHAEVVALRTEIEALMGTSAQPGANPIELLLNLHGTHNVSYPFHFRHTSNASFDLVTDRVGVVPEVHQLEQQWIDALEAESPFVDRGTTQNSSMGAPARPYVEAMMHDRWSIDPAWLVTGQRRVMAITLEGTYGKGPDGVAWATDADYEGTGAEIGRAFGRYFGWLPGDDITSYGSGCGGTQLVASVSGPPHRLNLTTLGLVPNSTAVTVLGVAPVALPLPDGCTLHVDPLILAAASAGPIGLHSLLIDLPPALPVLDVRVQTVGLDFVVPGTPWRASNGVSIFWLP